MRRFAREMGDGLTDLLDLSRADITTKRPERKKRGLRQISELGAAHRAPARRWTPRCRRCRRASATRSWRTSRMPPSRRIGDIKAQLEAAIDDGTLEPRRENEYYVAWLEANRGELDV